MAKLRTYQSIDNGDYVFLFTSDPADLSSNDKDLMEKFGEPEINFGGTINYGSSQSFTLPDSFVRVISGMPNKVIATITADPWSTDTDQRLTAYRTTIQSRFSAAFTTLRANGDTFTNEYVINI